MTHRLSLPVFEGPFDLLLHLIKIDEVEITDVSLATVTDRYMEILRLMEDLDLEVAGDYLVVAASLIELKSRALLPQVELPEDEDEFEGDPRTELIDQIIEYQRYREISTHLRHREEQETGVHFRTFREALESGAQTVEGVADITDLLHAFQRVLRYAQAAATGEVIDDDVHVEDCMADIRERLAFDKSLLLEELVGDRPTIKRIIGMFLALLELIRLGEIMARQNSDRTELRVIWRPPDERPAYTILPDSPLAARATDEA